MEIHWDTIYNSNHTKNLGWYESTPDSSLDMIARCQLEPNDAILDVGAGSSTLVDHLLALGYQNIIAVDLSPTALHQIKMRIADNHRKHLRFITDDITHPTEMTTLENINLWHDRALLHFLHDPTEKQTYLAALRKVLAPDGFVIICAFSLDGADSCSGLPVHRYNAEMLADFLGAEFSLIDQFEYTFLMPSGSPRPFIYTRFQHRG